MTVKDILNISPSALQKMPERELRKVVGQLRDATNKKIKRLKQAGITSTRSLRKLAESGPLRISTKGKTRNELLKEYKRAKKFYTAKTSTPSGYTEQLEKTRDALRKHGIIISTAEVDEASQIADKLKELDPALSFNFGSPDKFKAIQEAMKDGGTIEDSAIGAAERLRGVYEEREKQNAEFDKAASELF